MIDPLSDPASLAAEPPPVASEFHNNETPNQISTLKESAMQQYSSPSASTSTPTSVRGRPRSSSISNGSPSPSLGSTIPLPSLFPEVSTATASPWTFKAAPTTSISVVGPSPTARRVSTTSAPFGSGLSPPDFGAGSSIGAGWGHRPSLSVPGIVSPLPVPAGGVARGGRHRRTQSVSPPGFPMLSDQDVSGFAPSTSSSSSSPSTSSSGFAPLPPPILGPSSMPTSTPLHRKESPSRGPARRESPSRASGARPVNIPAGHSSRITIPRAELSPIRHNMSSFPSEYSPSTSPTGSSHLNGGPHATPSSPSGSPATNHHAFSHAALLSGVRSHALPHHDSPAYSAESRRSPLLMATSPSSPPFGPTSPNSHLPSPLSLELHRRSPERELEEVLRRGGGVGMGIAMDDDGPPRSPMRLGAISPPLLPLPAVPGEPAPVARPRSSSFGRDPASPASRFLEKRSPPAVGHCDMRLTPEEQHRTSPPPEPPLLATSSPPIVTVPSSSSVSLPFSLAGPALGFEPFPATLAPPPAATVSVVSPPALAPVPLSPPKSTPAPAINDPTLLSDDLQPPPSPHHHTIALPPPHVAPAPLPPHLGGPPLHGQHAPRRRKSRGSKLSQVASADHVPKRHSPLATGATTTASDETKSTDMADADSTADEPEEQVQEETAVLAAEASPAAASLESEHGEMDLGMTVLTAATPVTLDVRALSPLGAPQHLEDSSTSAAYRSLEQHLAATPSPPKSGWDMDDPEEDDFDEGFASGSPPREGAVPGLELGGGLEDAGDLALARIARQERESPAGSPGEQTPLPFIEPQSGFASLGFMDVDHQQQQQQQLEAASALGLLQNVGDESHDDVCAIDEESLSALERIFVCAKSDSPDERVRVANNLPEWLLGVDICEAAEYVLPLLGGLATDQDDYVKEAFALQLDRVMWHFFSQCPLIELDPSHDSEHPHQHHSTHGIATDSMPTGSPVPSRYPSLHHHESTHASGERSPTSTHFVLSDDSAASSTPPPTSKTSPSNTEVADSPRISATTFTSLLGALLTDQSSGVAKSTEAALVRFLCRLKGKPIPVDSPSNSPLHGYATLPPVDDESTPTQTPTNAAHGSYQLTAEASRLLEDEFVTGIVLGLARLDEDEHTAHQDQKSAEGGEAAASRRREESEREPNSSPHLVLSPEEDSCDDGWLTSDSGPFADSPLDQPSPDLGWGAPSNSFFAPLGDGVAKPAAAPTSSPSEPLYSAFSPEPNNNGDDEAAIGKVVSMSLIAAIAATDCLDLDTLAQQILPEVERMRTDTMFYVRREAAQALGSLARTLPTEVIESTALPLLSIFAHDTIWHVRRAACLVLPMICKRLRGDSLRQHAVEHMKHFSADSSRNVRSGALEVCGELTYLFFEEPRGVPDEILSIFLGRLVSSNGEAPTREADATPPAKAAEDFVGAATLPTEHDDVFAPLANPLDSPPAALAPVSLADSSTDASAATTPWDFAASACDPDRPVMCAFNFPAIVLTLGRDKWPMLQPYHLELCQHKTGKVRQSLASSLHEVAKIIGPAQSDSALLEPFSWFLADQEHIQGAVIENLTSLLFAFGPEAGRAALGALVEAWDKIRTWRRRETLAKYLGGLGSHFMLVGASDEVLLILAKAFGDEVAAVREQAVYAIPYLVQATQNDEEARTKLWAFLGVFYEDASYRNRAVYTACALASVRVGISRELFEAHFLQPLVRLAEDRIINVRIGVSRVVCELCQPAQIYADASSRAPLSEILHILAHSPDREVKHPILPFYAPSEASRSPSPNSMMVDRSSGVRSRLQNHGDDVSSDMDEDDRPIPTATRSNPQSHGVHFDRVDSEDAAVAAEALPLGQDDDDDADAEMDFDEIKPNAVGEAAETDSPFGAVWSHDMVDDEGGFVEVHQRN